MYCRLFDEFVVVSQSWTSHRHSTDDVVTAWVAKQESRRCEMMEPTILDIGCGIGARIVKSFGDLVRASDTPWLCRLGCTDERMVTRDIKLYWY